MTKEVSVSQKNQRPYWFVDAKWIFGLFFMFLLGLTIFTFGLYQASNESNGVETLTKIIALEFSRNGLDDQTEIDTLKKQILTSTNGKIKPIPTLNVTLSLADVTNKSPREIRYNIFRNIAKPIYNNGVGAESVLNDPEAIAKFRGDTFILRVLFSENSHNIIGNAFLILALLSTFSLTGIVFFSYRFGRIANPGFVILMTCLPWLIVYQLVGILTKNISDSSFSIGENGAYGAMIGPFVRLIVPDIAAIFSRVYLIGLATGIGLLVVAGIGRLTMKIVDKIKSQTSIAK